MIVVDCAALIDALLLPSSTVGLRAELARGALNAPDLIDFEVVSVARGLVLGGKLGEARALELLDDFAALPLRRWRSGPALRARCLSLRDRVSAYDAAYVVLAEALECPLVTRDARLARGVEGVVEVRVL